MPFVIVLMTIAFLTGKDVGQNIEKGVYKTESTKEVINEIEKTEKK